MVTGCAASAGTAATVLNGVTVMGRLLEVDGTVQTQGMIAGKKDRVIEELFARGTPELVLHCDWSYFT